MMHVLQDFGLHVRRLLQCTGASWGIPSTRSAGKERMAIETGTVKWFSEGRGFGFVTPDGGGKDLFAHSNEIQGKGFKVLAGNQRVEFEVGQGPKGPQALRIRAL